MVASLIVAICAFILAAASLLIIISGPRPPETIVEDLDDLADPAGGCDMPTHILPVARPGKGYKGRYRRASQNQRLADLGRAHDRRGH